MEGKLRDVLDPAIMDAAVEGGTKDEVLRRMSAKLLENGYISDLERFVSDIYRREADGPTGMGGVVSIPHGRSSAARKMGIAVGRTAESVRWESCVSGSGWQETRLVFLFCVLDDAAFAENHLSLLSQLAEKLGSERRIERLLGCRSRTELLEVLLMEEEELAAEG